MIVPRLVAAKADTYRVHRVEIRQDGREELLTLPDDVEILGERIREARQQDNRNVTCLVIDPISAFLSSSVDSHKEASVRRALAPLARLAAEQELAVVVVAHLTKNEAQRLVSRISGSGAFGAAVRSVLAFARHPDDPDGERGADRVIVHARDNWGRYAPTLGATIIGTTVPADDGGEDLETARLEMTGEVDIDAGDLDGSARGSGGPTEHEEEIAAVLADGPRPAREVKRAVARTLSVSERTVERAFRRLEEQGYATVALEGFQPPATWSLTGAATVGTRPPNGGVATGSVATARAQAAQGNSGQPESLLRHTPGVSQLCPECGSALTSISGGEPVCIGCRTRGELDEEDES